MEYANTGTFDQKQLNMEYQSILLDFHEGILTVTINRESKMNALNLEVIAELTHVMRDVRNDEHSKAVIITGAGHKAFVAGADIAEFAAFDSEEGEAMSRDGHELMNLIENSPKPVVAAVNGFALGGGCELAMACHLRVASTNAHFGQPEVKLGLIPGYGGTQRLIQLIGKGKALEMLMTGEMIDAGEALKLGLVNKISEPQELLDDARALLQKIMKKAPLAIAKVIDSVNAFYDNKRDGFEVEIRHFGASFDTQDFKEGSRAFLEKRKARFIGK